MPSKRFGSTILIIWLPVRIPIRDNVKNTSLENPFILIFKIFLNFFHWWTISEALARICADSQSVVDLYVNYDCDINGANIFERLVGNLARLVQTKTRKPEEMEEESIIRMKALECLVSMLKCMVEWSRELYTNPHLSDQFSIMGKEYRNGLAQKKESYFVKKTFNYSEKKAS